MLASLASANSSSKPSTSIAPSIFGDWKGEGDVHRRAVRLELADYLIEQKDIQEAQSELVIVASNARSLPDAGLDLTLGDAFIRIGDTANSLKLYQKAMADAPRNPLVFEKAGRVAYRQGDYAHARDWLEHALRESAGNPGSAADPEGDTATLLKNSEHQLVLTPALAANRADRVARELRNRALAKQRLDACIKQDAATEQIPTSVQAWSRDGPRTARTSTREALLRDATNEDDLNGW